MNTPTLQFKKTNSSAFRAYVTMLACLTAVLVFAVYLFGARVLVQALIAVCVMLAAEAVCCLEIYQRRITAENMLSAAITGVLCALLCPVSATHIMPMFMASTAAVIKHAFGGRGKNLINPAFGSALVSELLFGDIMHSFTEPFKYHTAFTLFIEQKYIDASVSASPLEYMLGGNELTELDLPELLLGFVAGKNGETSVALLFLLGVVLLCIGISEFRAGASYLATLFIMAYFFPIGVSEATYYAIWQVITGAVMIVAVFGMSDPTTTPAFSGGRIIFGVGCGLLTYILRVTVSAFDGAIAALVIMNLLTPLINALTAPAPKRPKREEISNA